MITCSQCGQTAPDETRFCERCGRQLLESERDASLPTLEVGRELLGGYKIVEVLSQTSGDNWYRAVQNKSAQPEHRVLLRERSGPAGESFLLKDAVTEGPTRKDEMGCEGEEDPRGPKAKTRELAAAVGAEDGEAGPTREQPANVTAPEPQPGDAIAAAEPSPSVVAPDEPGEEGPAAVPEPSPSGEACDTSTEASATDQPQERTQPSPPAQTQPAPDAEGLQAAQVKAADGELEPTDDLGELFSRVRDLSRTLNHPAFHRALDGFRDDGRVYLAYPDEALVKLSAQAPGLKMSEWRALSVAIQVCQAVSFVHKHGFRMNDICPDSVAVAPDGRIKLTGLDWITNDNEVVANPLLNDGYTAPETYRGRRVDKRADIFAVGCLLYSCLTGERIECETWLEDSAPLRFYPPHVVAPDVEKALRRALAFRPEDRYAGIDEFKGDLVKANSTIHLRTAALSDVGRVRELNEDSILALEYLRDSLIEPAQAFLYVVADGMGGAAAGEVASAIAVATIREYVEAALAKQGQEKQSLPQIAIAALEEANRKIIDYQQAHPEARGMGTTGVVALLEPPKAAVAWVGDSRAYLHDGTHLRQVTKDHSLVQRLVDIGQITPEQARHHEHKNVILRSLGARQSGAAGAEAVELTLKRGDRLLLCCDGLIAHVEDEQIGEILSRRADPLEAARELIVAANAGGGTDNISVILVFAE